MKTIICKIAAILMIFSMALSLYSCTDTDMSGKIKVVIGGDMKKEYIVEINKLDGDEGLISVLKYLKKTKKIDYKIEYGQLTKIGTIECTPADGKEICVYTTVQKDVTEASSSLTIDYDGQNIKSVGVALRDMHIEEYAVIYIGVIRYV